MGQCLSVLEAAQAQVQGHQGPEINVAQLSNGDIVHLLASPCAPELKLRAAQHVTALTSHSDEQTAAARSTFLELGVLPVLSTLMQSDKGNRPALRVAAAQAACNLALAAVESERAVELISHWLSISGPAIVSMLGPEAVRDGPLAVCQVRSPMGLPASN